MTNRERSVLLSILLLISFSISFDLVSDYQEGAAYWHLLVEGFVASCALFGTFYILRDMFSLRRELRRERELSSSLKQEAENWRQRSQAYLAGLSQAIDQQLSDWNLTPAEKEVAFLLLKGMSLKEVAHVRNTTEKTARVQSMAIYSKAGLAGRSELAAFFLEDLLLPTKPKEPPQSREN